MKLLNLVAFVALSESRIGLGYPADTSLELTKRDPPKVTFCPLSDPDPNFLGCSEIDDIANIHNPGVCRDLLEFTFTPEDSLLYFTVSDPGFCVIFHEGTQCSDTASGPISVDNPQTPPDQFWQTHTASFKIYRTVDHKC